MKGITINRSALRDGCKMVASAVKGKSMMPILDSMLVSLDAEKGLCLRATDTTLDIKVYVDTEAVEGTWEACLLNTRMFTDMVDKFDGTEISLEQKASEVALKSGGCKGKLVFVAPDEYPAEPDMSSVETSLELQVDKISSAVDQVEHAALKGDATRPVLERICIIPSDDGVYMLALDGFRMERRGLEISENISRPLLLNADKLAMVISAFASIGAGAMRVICTTSWCSFESDGQLIVRLRRYDEQPISVAALIKPFSEQDTLLRIRRKELLAAAQRAVLFAPTPSTATIKMRIEENAVVIHAASTEGEISSTVDANFAKQGKLKQIAFNSRYLIECLKKGWSGADEIDIGMTTDVAPMIVAGVGAGALDTSLVLPVRIFEAS